MSLLFNTVSRRGAAFSTSSGDRFRVSAGSANPTHTPVRFGDINPQYPRIFRHVHPRAAVLAAGTAQTYVRFFVPGASTPAQVKGVDAAFTDVDSSTSTKIELYDRWGARLRWNYVPRGTTAHQSLSFLGVETNAKVYSVKITSGKCSALSVEQ